MTEVELNKWLERLVDTPLTDEKWKRGVLIGLLLLSKKLGFIIDLLDENGDYL